MTGSRRDLIVDRLILAITVIVAAVVSFALVIGALTALAHASA